MSYVVTIKNNMTGETKAFKEEVLTWDEHSKFFWTEGNFGCDCNRYLVWNGYPDEEDDTPCGEVLFTVLYVDLPTGERIFIDPPEL